MTKRDYMPPKTITIDGRELTLSTTLSNLAYYIYVAEGVPGSVGFYKDTLEALYPMKFTPPEKIEFIGKVLVNQGKSSAVPGATTYKCEYDRSLFLRITPEDLKSGLDAEIFTELK